jgi:hypothetical protein
MTNVTKAQLKETLEALELQMEHILKRTGCPDSFMPIYKLADHLNVSETLIAFAIKSTPTIKPRVYSTRTGGHIINCKGYPINTVKAAAGKIVQDSFRLNKEGKVKHNPSGRTFNALGMIDHVGKKL